MEFKKVVVMGLGYVGLPTAALIASRGITVFGIDTNPKIISSLKKGMVHIAEPDIDTIINSVIQMEKLIFKSAPVEADAFIIAVPTPLTKDKSPKLTYVRQAVEAIAPVLKRGNLIILESTSPVGTTEQVKKWLLELRHDLIQPGKDDALEISIAYCPERILPGSTMHELVINDRVIGGLSQNCALLAKSLYKKFVKGNCWITNARTAEFVKLAENAYRDVNIAFANELSMICHENDINVWEAIELCNRHPRVSILNPGPGVGGHCIAVDPWFLIDANQKISHLMKSARDVNEHKAEFTLMRILNAYKRLDQPQIGIFGLSYKADTNDLRESPAIVITDEICENIYHDIFIVEPHINELPETLKKHKNLKLVSFEDALTKSDLLILLVDHSDFKNAKVSQLVHKHIIDMKGIWSNHHAF